MSEMKSDLCKTDMNLIRGGRCHSLDNTDLSFVLSSHLSILPLIWAKIGYLNGIDPYGVMLNQQEQSGFMPCWAAWALYFIGGIGIIITAAITAFTWGAAIALFLGMIAFVGYGVDVIITSCP
jgi:hypothetical protein